MPKSSSSRQRQQHATRYASFAGGGHSRHGGATSTQQEDPSVLSAIVRTCIRLSPTALSLKLIWLSFADSPFVSPLRISSTDNPQPLPHHADEKGPLFGAVVVRHQPIRHRRHRSVFTLTLMFTPIPIPVPVSVLTLAVPRSVRVALIPSPCRK